MKHESQLWRDEITKVSAVDGYAIPALPQKVIKEPQADGCRKGVRVN